MSRSRKFGGKEFRYFATYFLKSSAKREQKSKSRAFYTRITPGERGFGQWILWIRLKSKR